VSRAIASCALAALAGAQQTAAPYQALSVAFQAAENDRKEVMLKRISVDQMETAAKPTAQ